MSPKNVDSKLCFLAFFWVALNDLVFRWSKNSIFCRTSPSKSYGYDSFKDSYLKNI